MAIVKTENLTHVYSAGTPFEHTAVDNVSIEIDEGEIVGVIGHTGSGKSTLIQHFNGLLKPTSGRVLIGGEDIWEKPSDIRRFRFKVGLVFQYPEYQLFEETVYKDIAFGPKNMELSEDEIDVRVRQAARTVEISEELFAKSPFELSGGQKRRVAIAGVIAMDPEVLILDEPTAGLDPQGRDRILGQLREYHETRKNCVMVVSHSMEDIAKLAKKVLVINESKIFTYDTVDAVFSRAAEIEAMGLTIPQVARVMQKLRARGIPLPGNIFTVDSAERAVLAMLEGKGGNRDA